MSTTQQHAKALRDKQLAKVSTTPTVTADDMRVVDYWETRFLPYCQEELKTGPRSGQSRLKPSTLRHYKHVYRCWKDRAAYDERKYLAALAKRGSPLGKLLVVGVAACEIPCGS